ncbi:hypothetical protein ACSBOB_11535 [Mesorhizobium sp. ASY16-5R]|uniref:hypothetical protein n=1 Tax=Mesorhizobium sp. ASY16-5R TaxID=3445772 RepID=UPI003FA189D8
MPNTTVRAAAEGMPTVHPRIFAIWTRRRRQSSLDLLRDARAVYIALDALPGCVEGTPEAAAADRVYDAAMSLHAVTATDVLVKLLVISKWSQYECAGRELASVCQDAARIIGVPAPGRAVLA